MMELINSVVFYPAVIIFLRLVFVVVVSVVAMWAMSYLADAIGYLIDKITSRQ